MNQLRHFTPLDLLLIISSSLTGASLLYLIMSSTHVPKIISALLMGLGVALLATSVWWNNKKHATVVVKEYIEIEVGGRHEILMSPSTPVEDPRLYMTSKDLPVVVEEVWWGSGGTLTEAAPLKNWSRGVTYPGTLDDDHKMKILLRNEGSSPAKVLARVATHKR
jgi:hypothetical protein